MSFNFQAIQPYLPIPLVLLKNSIWDKVTIKDTQQQHLLDTAIAVSGYFLAKKLDLNLLRATAYSSAVRPGIARQAICWHLIYTGLKGVIESGTKNVSALITNLAFAAVGYALTTTKGEAARKHLVEKTIYSPILSMAKSVGIIK